MLQIAICDDETLLLEEIRKITEDCLQSRQTFSILSTYTNGKELFYDIQDGKRFDLLLLDIEMPGLSGMELAGRIHELLPEALMLFVTAHYKYAVDAYELHIFRYIPKNQLKERLPHALRDAVSLLEIQNTDSYIISSQNRLERIPLKKIFYIEKEGKNAVFHTAVAEDPETVDAILNHAVLDAQKQGIEIDVNAEFPKDCNITSDDLCVILFNLLDNAMEACLRYMRETDNPPRMEVTLRRIHQFLIIKIQNPCVVPRKLFGIFPTTKADARHHGIGLRNVREKVEKYNGSLELETAKDMFTVTALLFFEKSAP